jgi:hypothetical protein
MMQSPFEIWRDKNEMKVILRNGKHDNVLELRNANLKKGERGGQRHESMGTSHWILKI